ncbi:hypothetical protein WMY93_020466 [Mugilogobius chulae]|uniref:Uncharacterized protein n=1 Tax=Mugilogobius chulae TaxID=88201 RepID=A0AAW0NJZ2_9GOBI
MASSSFSEDLTCSICLSMFTDPVTLLCGHSFCRECISACLDKQASCPQCRASVDMRGHFLLSSHVLKSLVEKAKLSEQSPNQQTGQWMCAEHDEKLKLFCLTDRQLICMICRDAQKHDSHKFKPVSEAAAAVKADLENLVQNICADTNFLKELAQTQIEEVNRTKQRACELRELISDKFEKMVTFLNDKKRELSDKVSCDEAKGVNRMTKRLREVEDAIAQNKKIKTTAASALEIQDAEQLLKMCSEEEEGKALQAAEQQNRNLQVEKVELSLGPYESHLQMFMWKEMLQVVEPREEQISLSGYQSSLVVSPDECSAFVCPHEDKYQCLPSFVLSYNRFESQHYWEVHVGEHGDWHLGLHNDWMGLPKYFLRKAKNKYYMSEMSTLLNVQGQPSRVGVYLNCPKKELSFYNADTMAHIHTVVLEAITFPVSAYFKLSKRSKPHTLLTVCRY